MLVITAFTQRRARDASNNDIYTHISPRLSLLSGHLKRVIIGVMYSTVSGISYYVIVLWITVVEGHVMFLFL